MDLSSEEKEILLAAARSSIKALFDHTDLPQIDYTLYPNMKINAGAFVTITKFNRLRGCIGNIMGGEPLYQTVCEMAVHASIHDPRFSPISKNEFDSIEIEISVLSVPHSIKSYDEIEVGRDGLILDEQNNAVLLPQVAVEHNMSREEFLSALCEKAGLPAATWRQRQLKLKTFEALVFNENENL